MDDKNQFLNNYKKKLDDRVDGRMQEPPEDGAVPESLHFEEKSEFVPPRPIITGSLPLAGRRSRKAAVFATIAVAAVFCAALGAVWYFGRIVEVISLTNWTVNDAQLWAGDSAIKLQVEEQYNDEFAEGRIIAQDLAPGTKVNKGAFLKIKVSLGHDLTVALALPDLKTMTMSEIESWAAANYMTKVRITTEYNDEIAAGKVISFTINDNTVVDQVKRNTPIYVIISKGKEDTAAVLITIPNFKQMTIPQSHEFANENGLALKISEQFDDYAAAGSIIAQSVKAEEKVGKGTEIALTVSLGKKIILPDFTGYSKQKATAAAAQLGISATITERYSSQPTGAFLSQSSAAGTIYKAGDFLELVFSLGNKIVLSSFIGQTRSAIEKWAKELNEQGAAITLSTTFTQSNLPKDQVIYQDKTNTLIDITATLRITVSLGLKVFMPDLVAPEGSGYDQAITREKALNICTELGIIPVFVSSAKTGRLPGEIWSQSIAAGNEVYAGSTVTLKYCPANVTAVVQNFVGLSQEEISASGYLKVFDIKFIPANSYREGYAGIVLQQSLPALSTVAFGSTLTLTVGPPAP